MDNVITIAYQDDTSAVIIAGDNSTAGFPKERLEINTNNGIILGDHFVELTAMGFGSGEYHFHKTYGYKMAGETLNTSAAELAERMWEWRKSVTKEERATAYYYERMAKVASWNGIIKREYALGRGRVDIVLKWRSAKGEQRLVMELQTLGARDAYETLIPQALKQTANYADACSDTEAHIIVFDRTDKMLQWRTGDIFRETRRFRGIQKKIILG